MGAIRNQRAEALSRAAKTNAEFAEILRMKVKNMEQDQWSRPSNTRAARIMDYDILILKLSKDTVDNAA